MSKQENSIINSRWVFNCCIHEHTHMGTRAYSWRATMSNFQVGYRRLLSTSLGGSAVASQGFYRNGGGNSKGKYPQCPVVWMSSAGWCGPCGVTQWFLLTFFSLCNPGDHSSRETSAYKDGRCGPVSYGEVWKDITVASRPWRTRSVSLMDSWDILELRTEVILFKSQSMWAFQGQKVDPCLHPLDMVWPVAFV